MPDTMRVTVCELPQEPVALAMAWAGLCRYVSRQGSDLVLLPEFAMVDMVWESERFDAARWAEAQAQGDALLERLPELGAELVVGTRPTAERGRRFNEGYLWSRCDGLTPLRRKHFLPAEPGAWETAWFDRGDTGFPAYESRGVRFGLNICTELWALESYAGYAEAGVQVILSPRATEAATVARWFAAGMVAAVRSGAFSLSSNRVDPTGACGGAGWVIGPEGEVMARTTPGRPWVTVDIDLAGQAAGRNGYPRYVFGAGRGALD
jgi:N-carbamoylputrescine amidase